MAMVTVDFTPAEGGCRERLLIALHQLIGRLNVFALVYGVGSLAGFLNWSKDIVRKLQTDCDSFFYIGFGFAVKADREFWLYLQLLKVS